MTAWRDKTGKILLGGKCPFLRTKKNSLDKKIIRTKNCKDKKIVCVVNALDLLSWVIFGHIFVQYLYLLNNLLDTKLAYESSDIEHWTSCIRIVYMLGWVFLCLRCSWCLSTPLLFAKKSQLLHSNVFKMHRCFRLMWFFRTPDRWEVSKHMLHDFGTGAAPLCLCVIA